MYPTSWISLTDSIYSWLSNRFLKLQTLTLSDTKATNLWFQPALQTQSLGERNTGLLESIFHCSKVHDFVSQCTREFQRKIHPFLSPHMVGVRNSCPWKFRTNIGIQQHKKWKGRSKRRWTEKSNYVQNVITFKGPTLVYRRQLHTTQERKPHTWLQF